MSRLTWLTKIPDSLYRYPASVLFRILFGTMLFDFKGIYIAFAIWKLRFIYLAASTEFIGDFCNSAIFFNLRSVASL